MNNRGSLQDTIYGPIKLLGIAIAAFIGLFVWFNFNTAFQPFTSTLSAASNALIQEAITNVQVGLLSFDYVFPFIVIGLLALSLVFAFKTGASVVYAMFSIILWFFALMLAGIFTNIFGQFEIAFPTVSTALPIVTYIMDNMKWLVLFWLALITIVIFTRNKPESDAISAQEMAFGGQYG